MQQGKLLRWASGHKHVLLVSKYPEQTLWSRKFTIPLAEILDLSVQSPPPQPLCFMHCYKACLHGSHGIRRAVLISPFLVHSTSYVRMVHRFVWFICLHGSHSLLRAILVSAVLVHFACFT